MSAVADAHRALEVGDSESALRHLLVAWREHRLPRLADLIDRVSAKITAARGPIEGARIVDLYERWSAVEQLRDAGDLERLLAVKFPSRWKDGLAWLDKLAAWPDDPRLSKGLSALLSNKPYKSMGSEPFWRALLDLLVRQRDARVLDTLQGANLDEFSYSFQYKNIFARAIESLIDGLSCADTPPLTSDMLACCEMIERAMMGVVRREEEASRTEEDFLAEIFASPERDDVRQVYADWLMQRDDPRGEFIALQCTRRSGAPSARERALLKPRIAAWCGPLDPVLRSEERHFERGFLARAIGRWEKTVSVEPLIGNPYWSTVYALTGPEHGRVPAALVSHPVMRSLRVLHNVWSHTAHELDALVQPLPIEEFGVLGDRPHALGQGPGLSSVRHLLVRDIISINQLDWLWDSPLLTRIVSLSLAVYYPENGMQYLDAVVQRAPATITEVTLMDRYTRWPSKPEGWCMRFRRGTDGRFSALEAFFGAHHYYVFDIIGDVLGILLRQLDPGSLRSLVVHKTAAFKPTERQQAALAAEIRRLSSLEHIELPFDLD